MGTLVSIAWRNLWRHGKCSALTMLTMAFGLGLDAIINLTGSPVAYPPPLASWLCGLRLAVAF